MLMLEESLKMINTFENFQIQDIEHLLYYLLNKLEINVTILDRIGVIGQTGLEGIVNLL